MLGVSWVLREARADLLLKEAEDLGLIWPQSSDQGGASPKSWDSRAAAEPPLCPNMPRP